MGDFLIAFCLLCLVFVIFFGGKFAAEGVKSALKTERDPDILIEDRLAGGDTWKPKVKERRKGKYKVVDAYMTKSIHFAIELLNVKTGKRYTVYDKLPTHAEAKADAVILTWQLQDSFPEDAQEGKFRLPRQPKTGERVT